MEELNNFEISPNIVKVMKSGCLCWTACVFQMGRREMCMLFDGEAASEQPFVWQAGDGKIFKLILRKDFGY